MDENDKVMRQDFAEAGGPVSRRRDQTVGAPFFARSLREGWAAD
jgi:hypothetical protein